MNLTKNIISLYNLKQMNRKAIIIGATGLTGNYLLQQLLDDTYYSEIIVFARSDQSAHHPKVVWHTIDLFHIKNYTELFHADVVFCCIGTTRSKTRNKALYEKIDVGIPYHASQLAKRNGIPTFIVISAIGAKTTSRFFYNRIKGKMEERILSQNLKNTYILRPSLIKGKREENRFGETLAHAFMAMLKPLMLGDLEKYAPISYENIVHCMIFLDKHGDKNTIIDSTKIVELAERYD